MANDTPTLDPTPDAAQQEAPPKQATPKPAKIPQGRVAKPAATPMKAPSGQWDVVGELKKRYPGVSKKSDTEILQYLSEPKNFRASFPQYKHLDDQTIHHNINRELSARPTEYEKENTREHYWGFLPSHLYEAAMDGVEELAAGTYQMGKDILSDKPWSETGKKYVIEPLVDEMHKSAQAWKEGRQSEAVGHYVASYIPFLGPWAASLGEQAGKGDIGGALAKAGSQVVAGELAGKLAKKVVPKIAEGTLTATKGAIDVATDPARAAKETVRYVTGASDIAVEKARTAYGRESSETAAKHAQEVAEVNRENKIALSMARQAHEARVSDIDFDNQRAQAEYQHAVGEVRAANDAARDAVKAGKDAGQAAQQISEQVADALPKLHELETAKAKAAYPKIEAEVPRDELYKEMKGITDEKLLGAGKTPSSLARIIDETAPDMGKREGPFFNNRQINLDDPNDVALYQRAKAQGVFTPEEIEKAEGAAAKPISFQDLHGMYSELGRELYGRDLPGDSASALKAAREAILTRMENMAKAERHLDAFKKAQRGWQILENVFRNARPTSQGGSPVARALKARDPITGRLRPDYVRQALTNPSDPLDKGFRVAQELLDNYGSAKDLRNSLKILKDASDIEKAAPKKVKGLKAEPEPPEEKPMPKLAEVPGLKQAPKPPYRAPFDPAAWREERMEARAIELQKLRAFNFMSWRLPYTLLEQLISRMLVDPKFRKWAATDRPQPISPQPITPPPGPTGAPPATAAPRAGLAPTP